MRRWFSPIALAAVATALAAAPSPAQRGAPPKRPRLSEPADTNDARAYLALGHRLVDVDPEQATRAFYWAARIDPGLADAPYGRRSATLLGEGPLLRQFMQSSDRRKDKDQRALDSLQLRAVMLDPFLYRRLDVQLLKTYYRNEIERNAGSDGPTRGEIEHEIDVWLKNAGPYMRGWMAYGRGDFDVALREYAGALKQTKEKAGLHTERGRIFGMRNQVDSAVAELRLALAELRKRDAKDVVYLYNSKAVLEQSIGILLEGRDSVSAAREAYGRALQEDLSYWPAHVRLGMLAVAARDTAAAAGELALASQTAPDEAYVHGLVGAALAMIGKAEEAIAELQKAAALEPYYALPHLQIARVYDAAGFTDEATAAYRGFLARAARNDVQRAWAESRVAAIAAAAKP